MARYRANNLLFLDRLIMVGEEFDSELTPGRNWEPLDEEAKARKAAIQFPPEPKPPGSHDMNLVEIPENWRDLKGFDLLNLAKKLGMGRGNKDDAIKKIENEVAARALSVAA